MEKLLEKIREARAEEIDVILDTALRRKQEVYPEWEILYIALQKEGNQERQDTINWILDMLRREKDSH